MINTILCSNTDIVCTLVTHVRPVVIYREPDNPNIHGKFQINNISLMYVFVCLVCIDMLAGGVNTWQDVAKNYV